MSFDLASPGTIETSDLITLVRPIRMNRERLGSLVLGFTTARIRLEVAAWSSTLAEINRHHLHSSILALLLISGLILLAAGIVGLYAARRLSQPIKRLSTLAARMDQGQYPVDMETSGTDEIGTLERSVSQMAINLQRRTHDLEKANEMLMRADVDRRRFFTDFGHELRTPITVIRGEAEVTLRGGPKSVSEYRTTLRKIVGLLSADVSARG